LQHSSGGPQTLRHFFSQINGLQPSATSALYSFQVTPQLYWVQQGQQGWQTKSPQQAHLTNQKVPIAIFSTHSVVYHNVPCDKEGFGKNNIKTKTIKKVQK